MARKALLLGIESYDNDGLNNLEGVPLADAERLERSLLISGFEKDNVKLDVGRHGRSALFSRIRNFLVPNDDGPEVAGHDLYVYFSGHGVEYHGRRLWVPYDYDPDNDPETRNLFDEFEAHDIARQSAARSVVFFVDACRESIALRLTGSKGIEDIDHVTVSGNSFEGAGSACTKENSPTIIFIYSCKSGHFSYFSIIEKEKISLFTYAISEILKRSGDKLPSTLPEIINAAQRVLDDAARNLNLEQEIVLSNTRTVGRGANPKNCFCGTMPRQFFADG